MNPDKVYIGCSGYHYKEWRGKFYPEDLRQSEWLSHYAAIFPSVEINNSFYKIPDEKTLTAWKKETPEEFRFTLKGSRYITHMKKLKDPSDHLDKFYRAIEPIAAKTECILWQLPGNQHLDTGKLDNFCRLLSKDFINSIEFRHISWFTEETFEILSNHNHVSACSLSAPGDLPGDLLESHGKVYIRFHGKEDWYNHDYSDGELKGWLKKLNEADRLKVLFAYFNNDQNAHAPANAQKFLEMVREEL